MTPRDDEVCEVCENECRGCTCTCAPGHLARDVVEQREEVTYRTGGAIFVPRDVAAGRETVRSR